MVMGGIKRGLVQRYCCDKGLCAQEMFNLELLPITYKKPLQVQCPSISTMPSPPPLNGEEKTPL